MQTNIFNVLLKQSKTDLHQFLKELKHSIDELKEQCDTPEKLHKNQNLLKRVESNKTMLQARIAPIKQKFMFLVSDENSEFFDVQLTEEEKEQLKDIDNAWVRFETGLKEAKEQLKGVYNSMKSTTETLLDDFKKEIIDLRDSFLREAPKDKTISNEKAFEKIREYKELCEKKRD